MSTLTDIADELKQISDYAAEAKAIRMMQVEMVEQLRKVKEKQDLLSDLLSDIADSVVGQQGMVDELKAALKGLQSQLKKTQKEIQ